MLATIDLALFYLTATSYELFHSSLVTLKHDWIMYSIAASKVLYFKKKERILANSDLLNPRTHSFFPTYNDFAQNNNSNIKNMTSKTFMIFLCLQTKLKLNPLWEKRYWFWIFKNNIWHSSCHCEYLTTLRPENHSSIWTVQYTPNKQWIHKSMVGSPLYFAECLWGLWKST